MQTNDTNGVVLALDVGDVRIGVARGHSVARFPEPLEVIDRTITDAIERIKELVAQEDATAFVIGMPAYKSGDLGPQAEAVQTFAATLYTELPLPQFFVDESFSSQEADAFKKKREWKEQASNDALAACVILERYFEGAL